MIRRRSSITSLNKALVDFLTFTKFKRIKIFRSAVNYKKFFTLRTRFKRRQIMRLKHTRNWLIYLNIIKYWTDEYINSKRHARFTYKNRFFINNYIIINGNLLIRHQGRVFSPQNQWVASSITNKFLRKYSDNHFLRLLPGYKDARHVHAFFPTNDIVPNISNTPVISIFDTYLFAKNEIAYEEELDIQFDFDIVEDFEFSLVLNQCVELYKILSVLWYLNVAKNNQLNYYVFTLF